MALSLAPLGWPPFDSRLRHRFYHRSIELGEENIAVDRSFLPVPPITKDKLRRLLAWISWFRHVFSFFIVLLFLPPFFVLFFGYVHFSSNPTKQKRRTTNEELPSRQEYDTVCLFADVSGFTKLSEAMMLSSEGVEGLAKHLNSYFGQMVRIIASEGGDVFKVSTRT